MAYKVEKRGDYYYVVGETTNKDMGRYRTKKQAQETLQEISEVYDRVASNSSIEITTEADLPRLEAELNNYNPQQ